MTTVLIADDAIRPTEAWELAFGRFDITCLSADSWDETLKLMAQYRPACLVLEIHWSDEDGKLTERFDLIRDAKQRFPDVKICTMCSCCPKADEEDYRAESKRMGAEDFVPTKTLDMVFKVLTILKIPHAEWEQSWEKMKPE